MIQLLQQVSNWAYDHAKSESISVPLSSSVKGFSLSYYSLNEIFNELKHIQMLLLKSTPQGPLGNQGKTHKGTQAVRGTEQSPS